MGDGGMIKHVEELYCDRCGDQFEKRGRTTEIGWWTFTNGSGSRQSSFGRPHENLDQDLCEPCTEAFERFWQDGKR
jgi:hypothetical protein